jgi:calcium-dependent protein kinase
MGNKHHRGKKNQKIKDVGEYFFLDNFKIYDEDTLNRVQSIIHYDPNIIVSEVKKDPLLDYKIIRTIGEGTFGRVDLVEHKITGMVRAMKVIPKMSGMDETSVLNELYILKKIDHQNVIKIYEFYSDEKNYYLITEYCSGGDLFTATKDENLSEVQVCNIIYQILLALNNLHKMKIMHRDLKPENILITKKDEKGLYRIKLCDFGTSHIFTIGEKEKKVTGSSYYIAPEVLNKKYDFKCDLWSVGVIMYVLLTKKIPFHGTSDKEVRKNIKKKSSKYIKKPILIYSQYAQDLLEGLLEKDYTKRINAEKALEYDVFKVHNCKEKINQIDQEHINKYIKNIKKYKKHNAFQETAITYLIHNSESEEIWECQKLFNIFDVNNDGRISFSDFFGQMEKLSGETMDKTEAQKLFHIIDTNKSNYIEQEEFVKAGVDKTIFLEEKMLKLAFNFFDITNDGSISFEDIIELFRDSTDMDKDKEAKDEYEKIIKSFDKNNDGKLNFEGFSAFMKAVLQN